MTGLGQIWEQPVCWLQDGPHSDVVIASRIRLARNLENIPFPNHAEPESLEKVVSRVREAVAHAGVFPEDQIFLSENLTPFDRQVLLERRLISPEFAQNNRETAVAVDDTARFSVMVNEEDHLRLQILDAGLDLELLWEKLRDLESALNRELNFAFSEEFGYLTACPTNTGTGMRVSVLMHLPALDATEGLKNALSQVSPSGLSVRGFYGEGSDVVGNIYQISNKLTLGWTELRLLEDLLKIAREIVDKEEKARQQLLEDHSIEIEDRIYRSLGILERARILSSREFIEHYSNLMLGIHIGLITEIDPADLRELLLWVQPAHLQAQWGKEMPAAERDVYRAEFVRQRLGL